MSEFPFDTNDPWAWSRWILECDCEPFVTHCSQCDERRKVREQWEKKHRIEAMRAEFAAFDEKTRKEGEK